MRRSCFTELSRRRCSALQRYVAKRDALIAFLFLNELVGINLYISNFYAILVRSGRTLRQSHGPLRSRSMAVNISAMQANLFRFSRHLLRGRVNEG